MRLVIALGGNALLRRGELPTEQAQRARVHEAAGVIARLAAEHEVVLTHGNGPHVGLLALEAEAYRPVEAYGLDVLGAESQAMVGYLLEAAVRTWLPGRSVVTVLTQVEVSAADPAFEHPTKFIGPVYTQREAERVTEERGWEVARDGEHWRRVVPSPAPLRVLPMEEVGALCAGGAIVICGGGGGVPVVLDAAGAVRGVEGVIDKDLTAALIARSLRADALLLLTDVPAVQTDWGTRRARGIRRAPPAPLRAQRFAPGSMGPKVEAACRFVEGGGRFAAIGALADAELLLRGEAGTTVRADAPALEWWEWEER